MVFFSLLIQYFEDLRKICYKVIFKLVFTFYFIFKLNTWVFHNESDPTFLYPPNVFSIFSKAMSPILAAHTPLECGLPTEHGQPTRDNILKTNPPFSRSYK